MAIAWANDDVDFIHRRYDSIGSLHTLFDWRLFLPTSLRQTAIEWIDLRAGDRVLEVGGKLALPFSVWLMKRTVLGNLYIRPWEHLAPATTDFAMREFRLGSYYVCRGIKPPACDPPDGRERDA